MVLPARALVVLPARALVLVLLGGAARIAALPPRYDSVSIITARPPDARLVDAAQFGAVGDGIADDTDALQRAVNATYGAGLPDCTQPGARLVALEGGGRRYRVTAPLRLWIWVRLIGYGASRPQLVLAERTPGYGNSSSPLPLVLALDFAPGSPACAFNPSDGGNTAFGEGVLNVDVAVGAGNPGAVGVRNRAAQGGVLRDMRFDLAPDALAGVMSPGWAHQGLVIVGAQAAVLMADTGAWPAVFRDCAFSAQAVAGVAWTATTTSTWIGLTVVRGYFESAPVAVSARKNATAGTASARVTLLDCAFANISTALVDPPALGAGASSVLVRGATAAFPVASVMAESDIAPAVAPPPATDGALWFAVRELSAGLANTAVRRGDANLTAAVSCDAAAVPGAPEPPQPPAPDTPPFAPVASWVSVRDNGARGDGATDDAPALNALLATLAAGGAPARVFFPQGVYVLNSTLIVPPTAAGAELHLFGLSVWDVVLSLADGAPGFGDAAALRPVVDVRPGGSAAPWIYGLNIRSGMTWGAANPNPGALALQWRAVGGGVQDLFLHPNTFPDNARNPAVPNLELSLVVSDGGGGVFADVWSCNSYSMGGVRVVDTSSPVLFYQLSSEHHAGHELWLTNATNVTVHVMQTEDRSPDAAPTSSVRAEAGSSLVLTGLFSYYAASVSSPAAVIVDATSSIDVGVFRQWHSYHPLYYNCSVALLDEGGDEVACVTPIDFARVVVSP